MAEVREKSVAADPELDRRLMGAALRLGRQNLGRTYPNPSVGALVVRMRDGNPEIVGRGVTAVGGRPHAETEALAEAGDKAKGATVYVTLEPCSHSGRTPPCTDALIAAEVARVVMAVEDPDPRVGGTGRAALQAAGIAVTTGVLAPEAARAHAGHMSRVARGRPHVTLKLAVSADGMIGRREGERMILTGKPAFDAVQAMRTETDAVMIGIGTALVDDPLLTVRLPGLERLSPVRIILDRAARLPLDSRLVASARTVPLLLVIGPEVPAERREKFAEAGVQLVEVPHGQGGVDMKAALEVLGTRGFTRVLVEGGADVAASLVGGELVDEVVIFRAPVVVGPGGVRALGGYAMSAIERSPRFRQIDAAILGDDQMRRYLKV